MSENVITFVRVWLLPQMKNIPRLGKICFYSKTMLIAYAQLYENVSLHKCLLRVLYTLHFRFRKWGTMQFYLNVFRKRGCPKIYYLITRTHLKNCFLIDNRLIEYKMYFLKKARKIECPTLIFLSP